MTAFAVLVYVIMAPFIMLNIIWSNRPILKTMKFRSRFGMLTEELKRRNIIQLYYYPLFMFQRMCIAGIIVFLTELPYVQIFCVIGLNLAMLAYLLVYRPFIIEN